MFVIHFLTFLPEETQYVTIVTHPFSGRFVSQQAQPEFRWSVAHSRWRAMRPGFFIASGLDSSLFDWHIHKILLVNHARV